VDYQYGDVAFRANGTLSGNGTILADQLGYRGEAGSVVFFDGQDQGVVVEYKLAATFPTWAVRVRGPPYSWRFRWWRRLIRIGW